MPIQCCVYCANRYVVLRRGKASATRRWRRKCKRGNWNGVLELWSRWGKREVERGSINCRRPLQRVLLLDLGSLECQLPWLLCGHRRCSTRNVWKARRMAKWLQSALYLASSWEKRRRTRVHWPSPSSVCWRLANASRHKKKISDYVVVVWYVCMLVTCISYCTNSYENL